MKSILISTIVRNRESTLHNWYNQLKELVLKDGNNNYYLSVYENDSTDNSKEILKSFDFSFLNGFNIQTEDINTNYYKSYGAESKSNTRVMNLALARNKTIFCKDFLKNCSHVLCIEPDIVYNPEIMINEIINSDHDIISPISFQNNVIPYDNWATRKTKNEDKWDFSIKLKGKIDVWATFNCFCLYNVEPFILGASFGSFNFRFKKFDCDTSVVCEIFRLLGYNDIVMNTDATVEHLI